MIKLNKISKSYGDIQALDSVSFEVFENEIFGLIGADGAGKTTLFRILLTLILPDSGSATIFGYDIINDLKKIRNICGYMPGKFSLYEDLTVEENLNFFASVFGTSLKENYHLIKDIYSQIEPFKKRQAGKLSGGMKQKLALSCALIHKPKLLVLDEPTTGVDAVSRKEFWDLLKKLKKSGITILVSTPYMDEANLCDRIGLIQKGKILKIQTPKKFIEEYPYKIVSIKTNNLYHLINDLKEFNKDAEINLFGQNVHYMQKDNKADTDNIRKYLESCGYKSINIEIIEPTIEDCFIDLIKSK
ncbi:MAG: hypothetical protein Kow0068_04260 [Marinilabiliales bacterium]